MSEENSNDQVPEENEIIAVRKAKLAELRDKGNAFPNQFRRTDFSEMLHQTHGDASKEPGGTGHCRQYRGASHAATGNG